MALTSHSETSLLSLLYYLLISNIVLVYLNTRLGKLLCPRVNGDQKIDVGDQKLNSGRPHDYWILESLFYKI